MIGLIEHALALDPKSDEAQSLLADGLASRVLSGSSDAAAADLARAERLVGQALAASRRNAYAHFVKGDVLRAQRRCEEAIPEYETALASDRNFGVALNGLASCKLYVGSIDEVIPLGSKLFASAPRDPAIGFRYFLIGAVHLLQSRTDEAIVWLEKARSAIPAYPGFHALPLALNPARTDGRVPGDLFRSADYLIIWLSCLLVGTVTDLALVMEEHRAAHRIAASPLFSRHGYAGASRGLKANRFAG
jgi:tetratricopeptide (TPR) repeat protein